MGKVLVTTVPFGDRVRLPIELLETAGIEYVINPLGRKLREDELADILGIPQMVEFQETVCRRPLRFPLCPTSRNWD